MVIRHLNWLQRSVFIVIVGPRGAGKTALLTHFQHIVNKHAWALRTLREQNHNPMLYPKYKTVCYSNYPVRATFKPSWLSRGVILESKPLDFDKLVVWDKMFHDCVICIMEVDQKADRQDWYSEFSKFLTAGVQLMRHRNVSIVVDIMSIDWLNARLQWQADAIISCRDLSLTSWGREHNVEQGAVVKTTWVDKSGLFTGRTFDESHQIYERIFNAKYLWGSYDSEHEVDIVEQKTRYTIVKPHKVIDVSGEPERKEANIEAIDKALAFVVYSNNGEVGYNDFWARAKEFGFEGETNKYIQHLRDYGILEKNTARGKVYLLHEVHING